MKGGYLEDRFVGGCSNLAQIPYAFCHWAAIDTFVYFSHHLVTVPPVGWVSAAHTNGVRVLGTIITEWKDGEDTCARILSDHAVTESFVDRCVQLAEAVDFDGWLVNIENVVEKCM
jgi:mannosyl-glycoprotein endo-beta-N-acetylglucosaminidase